MTSKGRFVLWHRLSSRSLLVVLLILCASAQAAAPTKPPDTAETRNVYGPRADMLALFLPFNDATAGAAVDETALNAVGQMTAQSPRNVNDIEVAGASVWTSAEGGALQLAENDYVTVGSNAGEVDISFPRGTMLLRFHVDDLSANRVILSMGKHMGTGGVGELLVRVDSTGAIFVKRFAGDTPETRTAISADGFVVVDNPITVLVTWGERAAHVLAWNGTTVWGATLGGSTPTTLPIVLPVGKSVYLGANSAATPAGGLITLYAFGWWDWQLEGLDGTDTLGDSDASKLIADPYLPARPAISGTLTESDGIVQCARPQPWGCTWSFPADVDALDSTDSAVRIRVADSVTKLETDPTYVPDVGGREFAATDAGQRVLVPWDAGEGITGTRYWMAEFTVDGVTWLPSPQGIGTFAPRPASGNWSGKFAVLADCEIGTTAALTPAIGQDIHGLNPGSPDLLQHTMYGLWRAWMDIRRQGVDFILHAGDLMNTETHPAARAADALKNYSGLLSTAPVFLALGNHEGQRGYYQRDAKEAWKNALKHLKWFWCNPDGGTYPFGGESEVLPLEPVAATYRSNVDWIDTTTGNGDDYFGSFIYEDAGGADYIAKLGRTASPHENYYAVPWGSNVLIVVLDPLMYTEPGYADPTTVEPASAWWALGTRQEAWLKGVLEQSTAKWKFVVLHHLPGGTSAESTYYGRGSGASISEATSTDAEWNFHNICGDGGVTAVILGHDHVASHAVNRGVNYVHCPSPGNARFKTVCEALDYGDASLKGTDQAGVRFFSAPWGYLLFEVDGVTSCTLKIRQTVPSTGNAFWNYTSAVFNEWVGDEIAIAPTDTTVALDETPWSVLAVCSGAEGDYSAGTPAIESDLAGTNRYTNLADTAVDHFIEHTAYDEPYAAPVVSFANADSTTSVRVHCSPRTLYEATLTNAPGSGGGVSIIGETGVHNGTGSYTGETGVHAR